MKDKKRGDTIALIMTIFGIIMLWGGMIYALGIQGVLHPIGFLISFLGLGIVVAAYPLSLICG